MTPPSLSPAKLSRLHSLSTPSGVIAALAMDQRKSLRKMIAAAASAAFESVPDAQLAEFKTAVTAVLSQHASAVLLDPDYGLGAIGVFKPQVDAAAVDAAA